MRIQIDGTNTVNKGAELMLYAILEQIEKKDPKATVYYNSNFIGENNSEIATPLRLKKRFGIKYSKIPVAILRRLKISYTYFTSKHPLKNIDLVLDGAGFQFSDQWNYPEERVKDLEKYYSSLKKSGTRLVLLPQAFGPFKKESSLKTIGIISRYADFIVAREKVSYEYLLQAGAQKEKVLMYPDFTLLVKGIFPEKYKELKGKVCIIPNMKMVTHTANDKLDYLVFLERIILEIERLGKEVFLLNHEGAGDLEICNLLNKKFDGKYTIANNLNAKEVKGIIGSSFLVISSRFHGVASALNQGVPCLATSWNHKYEMLFKDFGIEDGVLNLQNDWDSIAGKLKDTIDLHDQIREVLTKKKKELIVKTEEMWDKIWT